MIVLQIILVSVILLKGTVDAQVQCVCGHYNSVAAGCTSDECQAATGEYCQLAVNALATPPTAVYSCETNDPGAAGSASITMPQSVTTSLTIGVVDGAYSNKYGVNLVAGASELYVLLSCFDDVTTGSKADCYYCEVVVGGSLSAGFTFTATCKDTFADADLTAIIAETSSRHQDLTTAGLKFNLGQAATYTCHGVADCSGSAALTESTATYYDCAGDCPSGRCIYYKTFKGCGKDASHGVATGCSLVSPAASIIATGPVEFTYDATLTCCGSAGDPLTDCDSASPPPTVKSGLMCLCTSGATRVNCHSIAGNSGKVYSVCQISSDGLNGTYSGLESPATCATVTDFSTNPTLYTDDIKCCTSHGCNDFNVQHSLKCKCGTDLNSLVDCHTETGNSGDLYQSCTASGDGVTVTYSASTSVACTAQDLVNGTDIRGTGSLCCSTAADCNAVTITTSLTCKCGSDPTNTTTFTDCHGQTGQGNDVYMSCRVSYDGSVLRFFGSADACDSTHGEVFNKATILKGDADLCCALSDCNDFNNIIKRTILETICDNNGGIQMKTSGIATLAMLLAFGFLRN